MSVVSARVIAGFRAFEVVDLRRDGSAFVPAKIDDHRPMIG
jgi:hypothetical protein